MASLKLKERFEEIERIAKAMGYDFYDVQFFEVPASMIWQVASYGLPTRYQHWSFGKIYQHQQTQGEMGYSKIYELILNSNPSVAYLDNTNTDTVNLLICAHCFGHSCVFKHNQLFRKIDETNMIEVAKKHAEIIDQFRTDYGDDEVDEWLDIALSLERHIDWYNGLYRKRYPERKVAFKERKPKEWEDIVSKERKPLVKKVIDGLFLPPYPEKDILWFLSEYATLEAWQKKIFNIVRRESYYFYPQLKTKILNEGLASFAQIDILTQYTMGNNNDFGVADIKYPMTDEEHLDFLSYHEKVVQPGLKIPLKQTVQDIDPKTGKPILKKVFGPGAQYFNRATRLNPYYVGFRIFRNIEERWNKYYEQGYMENEYGDKTPVTINGRQKVFEVMAAEDDVSLLRQYLTDDLAKELHLFAYGNTQEYKDDYDIQQDISDRLKKIGSSIGQTHTDDKIIANKTISVRSKEVKHIVNTYAKMLNNYCAPMIVVRRVDENGLLRLEHLKEDNVNVDLAFAEQVLGYIYKAWGRPVELIRKDKDKTWILYYDQHGFTIDHEDSDYPESIEFVNSSH